MRQAKQLLIGMYNTELLTLSSAKKHMNYSHPNNERSLGDMEKRIRRNAKHVYQVDEFTIEGTADELVGPS